MKESLFKESIYKIPLLTILDEIPFWMVLLLMVKMFTLLSVSSYNQSASIIIATTVFASLLLLFLWLPLIINKVKYG